MRMIRKKANSMAGAKDGLRECVEQPFGKKNYKRMRELLRQRLGEHRFEHSLGVAKTARRMAKVYGLDPDKARMAGLLHDWDKRGDACWVQDRARSFGLDLHPQIIDDMPWLLHGYTAAAALGRDFPELGSEVLTAIARHTTGAADMSDLDCVIYVADLIEPGRDYGKDSGIDSLRALVGEVSLQELYYQAFKQTLGYLIDRDKPLFPGTAELYNELARQHTEAGR